MAWKFPQRNTRKGSPIDIETVNDNFHEFSSEAGNLNEHNWSGDTTVAFGDNQIPSFELENQAAVKIHHVDWWEPHFIGFEDVADVWHAGAEDPHLRHHDYIPPYGPTTHLGISGASKVNNTPSWKALKTLEGSAQASTLWIMCSFMHTQISMPNGLESAEDRESEESRNTTRGAVQYGLRFNGAVIWESVTGTAEPDNDPYAERELHGPAALVLEAIVPATDGPFIVELVGRCSTNDDYSTSSIPQGEIMVFEFRR